MLRELDERRLISSYARLVYENPEDLTDDKRIRRNLESILDWDIRGDRGLAIFCSKYENLKRRDWKKLIQFIKDNSFEIHNISYGYRKQKREMEKKRILSEKEKLEYHRREKYTKDDYKVTTYGKPAKGCVYEGRYYKSRLECRYKEGITQNQLYRYLEKTGQV